MAEYMLDYTIWCYVRNQKVIDKMKEELDEYDLQDSEQYAERLAKKTDYTNKMKAYRNKIFKLQQLVYDNTELVDDRDLYIIDYEGYNKDHPRRKAQNNDDLQIVSREGSDSSPSPTRDQSMAP